MSRSGGNFRFKIVYNWLPEIEAKLPGEAERLTKETAAVVQSAAVVNLSTGEKTGRIYRRGGKTHQASAPGEAPAKDTGNLAASVQMEMVGPARAEVTVDAEYGLPLEMGTEHLGGPRPFFSPAVETGGDFMMDEGKKLESRLR